VEQVILKTLSKKPEHRYQKAGDLAEALTDAVELTTEDGQVPSSIPLMAAGPQIVEAPTKLRPRVNCNRITIGS
jgi:hypothetical protein